MRLLKIIASVLAAAAILALTPPSAAASGDPMSIHRAHLIANEALLVVGDWCSGVAIDAELGYVATAQHCVQKLHRVQIDYKEMPSGRMIQVSVRKFYEHVTLTSQNHQAGGAGSRSRNGQKTRTIRCIT